jgi:tetratricopeptide (TPR) repeat protein
MLPPQMEPQQVERLINKATLEIEENLSRGVSFDDHPIMAELHYERAQMYVLSKQYNLAIEDYTACLDYDPYFYDADMGREYVYMTMKEMDTMNNKIVAA